MYILRYSTFCHFIANISFGKSKSDFNYIIEHNKRIDDELKGKTKLEGT